MVRSKFQALLAETWKPEEPGDQIEGEIFVLDSKILTDKPVPFVELLDADGVPTQVLLGTYALQKVYANPDVVEGGYLGIRFDGESKTIAKAGNAAHLFSVFYYKPGDWSRTEAGEIEGKLCNLNKPSSRRLERLTPEVESPDQPKWNDYEQSDEPFNPEEPEDHPRKPKSRK